MLKKGKKVRKDLVKATDVWAVKRCRVCEILLGDTLDEIPDHLPHPEWHVDSGDRLCCLCRAELIATEQGLDILDLSSDELTVLISSVLEILSSSKSSAL